MGRGGGAGEMVRWKGPESGDAGIYKQDAKHILSCEQHTTVNELSDSPHVNETLLV